jgi:hypothetical protein
LVEKPKRKRQLERPSVAGKIILKWTLKKGMRQRGLESSGSRQRRVTGRCGHCKGTFGVHKIPGISWMAQDLHFQKRTLLQGFNFSFVLFLPVYGYCVTTSLCYISMQAKGLITYAILWYSLPSLD